MQTETSHLILAFYHFGPIEDPQQEVKRHKLFCKERDIKGRIYISKEGINGQMSASYDDALAYQAWLQESPVYKGVTFKIDPYHEHAFEKLKIKHRPLVALDTPVDMSQTGERLSPKEWAERLETSDDHILIDVRNSYEWEVGRFEGAETPACKTFREFRTYAQQLKEKIDKRNTPVMMYCTGGIRCELYSAYLKQQGFEKIYQLKGGIIQYGKEEGSKHWLGKLFVFDDRMTVPISDQEAPVIGKCHFCQSSTESYYNCANSDCNRLFLSCDSCLKEFFGCCQSACQKGSNVRPLRHQNPHKPFRKWYHYFSSIK